MNTNLKLKIFSFFVLLVMTLSLLSPSAVLADETAPPPEETEETAPPPQETEEPSVPTEETEEPVAPTEETQEPVSTSEGTEEPVPSPEDTLEATPAGDGTQESAVTEVPTEDVAPDSTEEPAPEQPVDEEETPVEQMASVLEQLPEDTDLVVLDQNGEPEPLVTQEAAETLSTGDPYIIRGGVTHRFLADCTGQPIDANNTCTESPTPIQAAIDFAVSGETIVVEAGTYNEQLTVTTANLTLQGDPGDPTAAGAGPNAPVLDGSTFSGNTVGISLYAEGFNLIGFVIQNFDTAVLQTVVSGNNTVTYENNTFQNNVDGVRVVKDGGSPGIEMHYNLFQNNSGDDLINLDPNGNNVQFIDATNNDWGCAEGPVIRHVRTGQGNDTPAGEVVYYLWRTSNAPNQLTVVDFPNEYGDCAVLYGNDSLYNNKGQGGTYDPYKIVIGTLASPEAPTATPTFTPTNTPTDTPTSTPTYTPTFTPTNTPTFTPTNTPTNIPTDTPTNTPTATFTDIPTDTPTNTPTDIPTFTPTPTDTPTNTPVPTDTPTNTPTATPTDQLTNTPTPTDTPTNTPVPTDTPTNTPTATPTDQPTNTPTPTDTPTNTPVPSDTPTNTPTATPTDQPTNTPTPTDTPTNTPVPTDTPTNTPTATPTDLPTSTPTATGQPTSTPTSRPENTPTPVTVPTRPSTTILGGFIPVTGGETHAIAAGIAHTCAIMPQGGVQCWGNNDYGQLGDGTNRGSNLRVDVVGLQGGTTIVAGGNHTCLLTGTEVWCWGQNAKGQIGDGTTTDRNTPVRVLNGALDITAGYDYTCATLTNGQVMCWGNNNHGQLADGGKTNRTSPTLSTLVSGISNVDAGQTKTCGLTGTGLVRCLTSTTSQELGSLPNTNLDVAVNRFGTKIIALSSQGIPVEFLFNRPKLISQLNSILDVDSGQNHICGLQSSGAVYCWGFNYYGQLGNNSTSRSSDPVLVSNLSNAWQLAVGKYHACAMTTSNNPDDPGIYCWGLNTDGQLGDGTYETSRVPVKVK